MNNTHSFLSACICGYYQSSERVEGYLFETNHLWFDEEYRTLAPGQRYLGFLIRPVKY